MLPWLVTVNCKVDVPPKSIDDGVAVAVTARSGSRWNAGCTDPLSVVETPQGCFFKSAKGFYLLGRDLPVQPIGAPVDAYVRLSCLTGLANTIFTGSVLHAPM